MVNLIPDWPAPPNIKAISTTRSNGSSLAPYDQNNLGLHVGDNPEHVMANRCALVNALKLPGSPEWLEQTHSTLCVVVEEDNNRVADAAITRCSKSVLAVMTADCQPILLCNKQGTEIAAIHAGWRGLVSGVVENTIAKMQSDPSDLLAWVGPAMCHNCYEVGDEVRELYTDKYPFSSSAFQKHGEKWLANLPYITERILNKMSVFSVYQSNICTFERKNEFFSYRREQQTGRMASLIWFN